MLRILLCLLLLTLLSSYTLSQTTGDDIPVVEVSDGRILLPSATSVCSTITTTIGNNVDYIPVPCADISHAPIWSEEVIVDGTTAELIISPSGNVRFVSETWLNANPSTPSSSRSKYSTNITATSTSSSFSKTTLSSYVSLNSSASLSTSLGWSRSPSSPAATKPSLHLASVSSGSVANIIPISAGSSSMYTSLGSGTSSTPMRIDLDPLNTASSSVTASTSFSSRPRSYQSATNTNSANLTYTSSITSSSNTNSEVSLATTQSTLFNSSSTTYSNPTTLSNAISYYNTFSSSTIVPIVLNSASSQLQFSSSGSSSSSSSPNVSTSQSNYKPANNAQATQITASTSSATTAIHSAASAESPTTSSFSSTPIITPPPKSSSSAPGNFTPPISSDLNAFETSGSSLITLSMSGQTIVLTRQTMSGFESFTGTTTVTTSEATTNSAGVVAWATGAVIIGTEGVFFGLALGSLGTKGFCIWPFCSGGGKGGSGFCIWPFCGGTGGGGGGGGGDGDPGDGDPGDGDPGDGDSDPDNTKPDERTQEEKTRQKSDPASTNVPTSIPKSTPVTTSSLPSSTPATTSSLPKSTTASTTASDPACPLFVIPSDSSTDDGSPTWNPNDPEYDGAIVPAAYAIWLIDSGSGTSEILPPLPSGTGYGDNAIPIGFIPGVGSGGGNSTNSSTTSTTTETITPMPVVVSSAMVSTSASSRALGMLDSSASTTLVQSVSSTNGATSTAVTTPMPGVALQSAASVQSIVAVESAAAAKSLAVVEIVAAIQSQASIDSIASAHSVASVESVSAASAASAASALSAASSASVHSALSVLSAASAASIASLPTPTPNLAIIIIRNDYCYDTCGSTGYIYDIVPSSPNVPVCNNPPWVHTYDYSEDVSNDLENYPINSGKFTSHGSYTNCEYTGSNDFMGIFSCDQLEGVFCSFPTEQGSSCTDSNSLYGDDWVPIVYCEWVAIPTTTTSSAAPATSTPVTCQVRTTGSGRIVSGHYCKCSDGSSPAPYIVNREWTCPNEVPTFPEK